MYRVGSVRQECWPSNSNEIADKIAPMFLAHAPVMTQ